MLCCRGAYFYLIMVQVGGPVEGHSLPIFFSFHDAFLISFLTVTLILIHNISTKHLQRGRST